MTIWQGMEPKPRSQPDRRSVLAAAAVAAVGSLLPGSLPAAEAGRPASPGDAIGRALLDRTLLDRALDLAASLDQLHALVIGRHGTVLSADAFRGPPVSRKVNVKSVSKTIVASLAGVALDRGLLRGVDATLGETAPELIPAGADPRVRGITVAQLLTMQAGLEPTSGPGYGRWIGSRNWVADALGRPFVAEPGERMIYSTGSYHVLGAVLARVAGRSLLALARDWLGRPLGIDLPGWTRDPQGYHLGGNNMVLSPLDLFRFGEMWSRGGVWNGRPVVSAAWAQASWIPRTRSPYSGDAYGFGWFLAESNGHRIAYARGYGGQMLYLVPSLGLTVVVTSDPTRPARSDGYVGELGALLTGHIMPAAELA